MQKGGTNDGEYKAAELSPAVFTLQYAHPRVLGSIQ
jgi:hypothetical protein